MSVYGLKPRFQALLRPMVGLLARRGVTANQVTVAAFVVSVTLGGWLCLPGAPRAGFAAVPAWMLLRMALNAIDGILAREYGQQSSLGAYLNELGDVLSDAALYAPFALVAPFSPVWTTLVILLAVVTEFAGVLGVTLGASRRYDGPMGKSDRALVFGILGLWIAVAPGLPDWIRWLMPALVLCLVVTTVKRVLGGLAELHAAERSRRPDDA